MTSVSHPRPVSLFSSSRPADDASCRRTDVRALIAYDSQ